MERRWTVIVLLVFLGILCSVPARSGDWPKIEAAISTWDGPKTLLLRSDLADPLTSPLIQALLAELLEKGFLVTPGSMDKTAKDGLILDVRLAKDGQVLALSRARDGAIIAFEKTAGGPPTSESRPPETEQPPQAAMAGPPPRLPGSGPMEIPGHPKNLALLGEGAGGVLDFALLYDDGLASYRLRGSELELQHRYRPDLATSRALHLSSGDLTGDGRKEIAAVWAQDVMGIYEGTDSQLHAWIVGREDDRLTPLSPDLAGHLRIVGEKGYLQNRGPNKAFVGPVFPLKPTPEGFLPGTQAVAWAGADLYQATPLDHERALVRDSQGSLQLRSLTTGKTSPGSVLLGDFSRFTGPQVAVRLANPEYRSGLGKDDRVKESYVSLPGRIALGADGAAYTVVRGRNEGLPLIGTPSGKDQVGRVVRTGDRLFLEKPFAEIESFIIDLAPLAESNRSGVLLLLNEKPDGSGRAYLLRQ